MVRSRLFTHAVLTVLFVSVRPVAAEETPDPAEPADRPAVSPAAFAELQAEVDALKEELAALRRALAAKADAARSVAAGDGLAGGGDLTRDRRLAVAHDDSLRVEGGKLGVAKSAFAAAEHEHDRRYYTRKELERALGAKAATDHRHDDLYPTVKAFDDALARRVPISRRITCGRGLTGGGDLGEDLVLAVAIDGTTLVADRRGRLAVAADRFAAADHRHDRRYYTRQQIDAARDRFAVKGRRIVAGAGLAGGGDLSADRTLAVVVDGETLAIDDRGLGVPDAVFAAYRHRHDDRYMARPELETALAAKAPTGRRIRAGAGLAGGGDLSADRELRVEVDGKTLVVHEGRLRLNLLDARAGQVPVVDEEGGLAWKGAGRFVPVDLSDGGYRIGAEDRIVFVLATGHHLHLPAAGDYPAGRVLELVSHDFVRVFCAAGDEIVMVGDGHIYRRTQTCVGQGRPFSRVRNLRLVSDGASWYELGR